MKDFSGIVRDVLVYGLGVISFVVVEDGDGRRDVRSLVRVLYV